jgi:hypothetical protein
MENNTNHTHEHEHDHSHEEGLTHEEIQKLIKASEEEYMNEIHNYFNNKFEEYIDLFSNLITPEDCEKVNIPQQLEEAKNYVTEEELKILVVFASMKKIMSNPNGVELMDVAEYVINQLEEASLVKPFSTEFIESIYNFKVVYTVLFSLLDLVENGRYRGEKMSQDYKMGVIDSIVALRKYQSNCGFGDIAWERDYNPAANKGF